LADEHYFREQARICAEQAEKTADPLEQRLLRALVRDFTEKADAAAAEPGRKPKRPAG
jgi:hypothetical protein